MGVNHTIPKQPLKPFRHFLPESFCGTRRGRASVNALNRVIEESNDTDITDATSIIIGSELPLSERRLLVDGFVNYLRTIRLLAPLICWSFSNSMFR
jgi:hypothetical protein